PDQPSPTRLLNKMQLPHLLAPILLLLLSLLPTPTLTSDTLTRSICHCASPDLIGYSHIFTYHNGRLNLTLTASATCANIVANPPRCSEEIFTAPGFRVCSQPDRRFCYDAEVWGHDEYSFDGKGASLGDAGGKEGTGVGCDEMCGLMGAGLRWDVGGRNVNEVFRDIEPGL
ncbi:MAG: hypothetical protein Q9208_006597, partial [Pyrenodesmia sp. 3 TL-2023]